MAVTLAESTLKYVKALSKYILLEPSSSYDIAQVRRLGRPLTGSTRDIIRILMFIRLLREAQALGMYMTNLPGPALSQIRLSEQPDKPPLAFIVGDLYEGELLAHYIAAALEEAGFSHIEVWQTKGYPGQGQWFVKGRTTRLKLPA